LRYNIKLHKSEWCDICERVTNSAIENPEIDPVNIVKWSLTKGQKQHNGEKIVFSTNYAGTTGHPHAKKKKDKSYLAAFKNSKCHRHKCKEQN
jgi:hypothetical protein